MASLVSAGLRRSIKCRTDMQHPRSFSISQGSGNSSSSSSSSSIKPNASTTNPLDSVFRPSFSASRAGQEDSSFVCRCRTLPEFGQRPAPSDSVSDRHRPNITPRQPSAESEDEENSKKLSSEDALALAVTCGLFITILTDGLAYLLGDAKGFDRGFRLQQVNHALSIAPLALDPSDPRRGTQEDFYAEMLRPGPGALIWKSGNGRSGGRILDQEEKQEKTEMLRKAFEEATRIAKRLGLDGRSCSPEDRVPVRLFPPEIEVGKREEEEVHALWLCRKRSDEEQRDWTRSRAK